MTIGRSDKSKRNCLGLLASPNTLPGLLREVNSAKGCDDPRGRGTLPLRESECVSGEGDASTGPLFRHQSGGDPLSAGQLFSSEDIRPCSE